MSFEFEHNIGEKIKYRFDNKNHVGTIVGTDVNDFDDEGCYLVVSDTGILTYDEAILELYEGGVFETNSYLSTDKKYHWIDDSCVVCIFDSGLKSDNKLEKEHKEEASDNFGRWLSGIDQYSEKNYFRGNSGFNWL